VGISPVPVRTPTALAKAHPDNTRTPAAVPADQPWPLVRGESSAGEIATPESGELPQCLGPEATALLAAVIQVGTTVRLEYDQERQDKYGRTLAAAFTSDGRMVNAEIACAGLARVTTVGENDRFREPIDAAGREASTTKRGMHAADIAPCPLRCGPCATRSPKLRPQPHNLPPPPRPSSPRQ
jgi:hypothetical protein